MTDGGPERPPLKAPVTITIPRFWAGLPQLTNRLSAQIAVLMIPLVAMAAIALSSDTGHARLTSGADSSADAGSPSATGQDLDTSAPARAADTLISPGSPVSPASAASSALVEPAAPPLPTPPAPAPGQTAATKPLSASGIPVRAKNAYLAAATRQSTVTPHCHLDWSLIAAIGRVESNHARVGGSTLDATGRATPPIYGTQLNGTGGTTAIADTDHGTLDADTGWDRAVGPMQFLPGTWAAYASDGDNDGVADPQDIDDAAATTAAYLCAGGTDLATSTGRTSAVFRYNHSTSYTSLVLALATSYAGGKPVVVAKTTTMTTTKTTSPTSASTSTSKSTSKSTSSTSSTTSTTSAPSTTTTTTTAAPPTTSSSIATVTQTVIVSVTTTTVTSTAPQSSTSSSPDSSTGSS